MTWQGENTTRQNDRSLSLGGVGDNVRGTHLTTFSSNEAGETYVRVFSQIIGDDVTELKRGLNDEGVYGHKIILSLGTNGNDGLSI